MIRNFCLPLLLLAALACALPAAAQTMSVVPHVSEPADPEFTIEIHLDTGGESIMGMEVSITFDEHVVRLDGIDPGPWFTGLPNEWFFWDYTHEDTELIHFTGSSLGAGVTDSGVVAICRFTALTGGTSFLTFHNLDLRDPENGMVPTGHSTLDKIIIDEAVATSPTDWAAIKALYR